MNIHDYASFIDLPHHVSKNHRHMSLLDRAAQFAPFAALTGYDEEIKETARLTSEETDLSDAEREAISDRLQILQEGIRTRPTASITCFVEDRKKQGGSYVTFTGPIRRIDPVRHVLQMQDGTEILFERIIRIESPLFLSID